MLCRTRERRTRDRRKNVEVGIACRLNPVGKWNDRGKREEWTAGETREGGKGIFEGRGVLSPTEILFSPEKPEMTVETRCSDTRLVGQRGGKV